VARPSSLWHFHQQPRPVSRLVCARSCTREFWLTMNPVFTTVPIGSIIYNHSLSRGRFSEASRIGLNERHGQMATSQ
jgi:hypothetical protein